MIEQSPWQVHVASTERGKAVLVIFPGGNFTIRDFDPAKVTVDTESPLGPGFTRAVYKHPMRHGGEVTLVHTADEGGTTFYGMMVEPAFIHWTPPAYFFDRMRMVMLGLVTEKTQDTLA